MKSCIDELQDECARLQCESDLMSIGRLVNYMKEDLDASTWMPEMKSVCSKGPSGHETNMCCLTNLKPVFASTEKGENECDFGTDGMYFFQFDDN